ncbi:hypothetical protein UFOVP48_57 [uncultured Caudovirales phage]|uniref:Uncharacterized protein n=1 Tax=uncultured Caudovirales phage TaxID=2100421 RepID=A0A6J5KQX4_9CAUD|nr:hypothetical protein UFOVP48_57 [uncultured Caudovirales phage]
MAYQYDEATGTYVSDGTDSTGSGTSDAMQGGFGDTSTTTAPDTTYDTTGGAARAGSGLAGTGSGLSGTGTDAAAAGVGSGNTVDVLGALNNLPSQIGNALVKRYTTNGGIDWAALAKDAAVAYAATLDRTPQKQGLQAAIPMMSMQRQQVNYNDPNRRPGSGGLNYFTNPSYYATGNAAAQSAAQTADNAQAAGLKAAYTPAAATTNPWVGKTPMAWAHPAAAAAPVASAPVAPLPVPTAQLATGGLASFAAGGANYLQGGTDGMADKLNTTIDDHQAAKLSHGEFVIPADVVSHLGNGNSDAGAQRLYDMMAKIRKARTGNPEQGKRIDPDKFMPGGLAKYAAGGAIAFDTGGVTPTPSTPVTPASTGTASTISDWAAPAVSNMISTGFAASNAPYQQYQGPLTAGPSDLQQQAFAGASDIASTGYTPSTFSTGTFGTAQANQYMNPYLQASLDPQLKELQRQSQINNTTNAGKLTQAGAYGGSRQAILEGEENRNLLDKSQGLISAGYNTAYNNAQNQFNAEQNRGLTAQQNTEQSRQFGAGNALDVNKNLENLGTTQRDITQQGMTADQAAFAAQRDNPLKMAQYQKDLLTGLPITTSNAGANTSAFSNAAGGVSDLAGLAKQLGITLP